MSIERFTNSEFAIEFLPDGDSFKVVGSGLAKALGFHAAKDMLATIPEGEQGWETAPTPGGEQRVRVLLEAGFYRAIGQRQAARIRDEAIRAQVTRFQSWVYGEVLPSLRRTGRYEAAPREMTKLEALHAAIESEEARLVAEQRAVHAEQQVKALEPSAKAWDTLADTKGDYSLRDAAFILNRDPNINTGQQRLMKTIRALGMVDRNGIPYAKHAAHLTERPRTYNHPQTGEPVLAQPQIRVTVKGLRYLHGKLDGVAPLRFEQMAMAE